MPHTTLYLCDTVTAGTKLNHPNIIRMQVLAKLNHPNIIRMYGVIVEPVPRGPASMRGRHESGSSASSGGLGGSGAATSSVAAEEMSIAGIMTDYVRGASMVSVPRFVAWWDRGYLLSELCLEYVKMV